MTLQLGLEVGLKGTLSGRSGGRTYKELKDQQA